MSQMKFGAHRTVKDPAFAHKLFSDTGWSWVWAILRVWLGYQWVEAGLHKVADPKWVATGEALKSYWTRAVAIPQPPARPAISYDWYRGFLQGLLDGGHYAWFGKVVAYGEVILGVLLIVGLFTGFMAFFGAFANMNFMLAGSASTNPVLFLAAVLILMAWKVAGHWGLDFWVLPALGTPWSQAEKAVPRTGT